MTHDAALPSGFEPTHTTVERAGVCFESARWTPQDLETLAHHLTTAGKEALDRIPRRELFDAWCETVAAFRDPRSAERQSLEPSLARLCQLSTAGLAAGLEAVLGGVTRDAAEPLFADAESRREDSPAGSLILVTLAANLPALAVQSLLPALLLRRPVILKSPTAEPLFAPAFVRALTRRMPDLEHAMAAITWKGGDRALEGPLLAAADRILAYGDAAALNDLEQRAPGKVIAYGPKTSLAVVGAAVEPASVVEGLARDIALFDQRGCLSIQSIFVEGEPTGLASLLSAELQRLARQWPPGDLDPVAAAGVQQLRSEADLRGLFRSTTPLAEGTVIIEPEARFQPSPGLRTVRIHPMTNLDPLPEMLIDWSGRLQGAALAGDAAWALVPELKELGISRLTPPGQLQTPDASWHNGGLHPFAALTGSATDRS